MNQPYTSGKHIALLIILSIAFCQLQAQPHISWQRSFGTSYDDYAIRLFEDPTGNIVVLGTEVHQDFTGLFRPYMVIAKVDRNGDDIWKEYHDVAFNTFNPPIDYYFGKHFYTHEFGETVINLVLSIGNRTMMYKVLDDNGKYYYAEDIPSQVIDLVGENEKIYAYQQCPVVQACYGPDSLTVQWIDPDFDSIFFDPVKWTFELKQNIRIAPIQGHYDFDVQEVRVDDVGNVYLLVQIERWDFQFCTDCADAFIDAWNEVFKFNPEGELIMHKRLDVTTAVVSSMGFVEFDNGDMVVRIDDINNAGTELETSIITVNASLQVVKSVNLHKQYTFIRLTPENEFVALSNTFTPNDPLSLGLTDIVLSRLDENGGLIWSRRVGGSGYDFGRGLLVGNENIVLLSSTDSEDHDIADPNGFTDIWLANLSLEPLAVDPPGTIIPLFVIPNPAQDWIQITVPVHTYQMQISNSTGIVQHIENDSGHVEVTSFLPGLYFIQLTDGIGNQYTGKFIKL